MASQHLLRSIAHHAKRRVAVNNNPIRTIASTAFHGNNASRSLGKAASTTSQTRLETIHWSRQQEQHQMRTFTADGGSDGNDTTADDTSIMEQTDYAPNAIMDSFQDTSYYDPIEKPDYSDMTNEELMDTSTIPGWEMIHCPPKDRSIPRGALVGTVVSTKMQKTVNVAVDRFKVHPKYGKRLRYTRKFMAHDEKEVAHHGDVVMIVPCHRISKHKHFMLREIIRPKGQL